jgi:DNA-binding response OmpR family regulator
MRRKIRILLVEDEEAIRAGLRDVLVFHGYDVDSAADGNAGLDKALSGGFDLILLDIMLPGVAVLAGRPRRICARGKDGAAGTGPGSFRPLEPGDWCA